MPDDIPVSFLSNAADILAEALTGPKIVRITAAYATDYNVEIPHAVYPFDAPNKRTALFDNLRPFNNTQQYHIIRELCDLVTAEEPNEKVTELKLRLMSRYGEFSGEGSAAKINEALIVETRHWLDEFPAVKKIYDEALQKHDHGIFKRNTLDDLRLALEKLAQTVFHNSKSLENQIANMGALIKAQGGSPQLANMFEKLIDYYTKYQNTYVKHDDAVLNAEIDFVFEITSSFMKHQVRLGKKQ